MKLVGSRSWRYEKAGGGMRLDGLLYVRDAFDLADRGNEAPPAFAPADPRLPRMLTPSEREEAAEAWPQWWQRVLDDTVDERSLSPQERFALASASHGAPREDADHLIDWPALQKAATIAKPRCMEWLRTQQQLAGLRAMDGPSDYPIAKAEAERIIAAGIDPEAVRALVLELLTPGLWWRPAAPGVVVCAHDAMDDADTARAILRHAYTSGLPPRATQPE